MNEQGAKLELLHVGESEPPIPWVSDGTLIPVALWSGDVVNTILKVAQEQQADLTSKGGPPALPGWQ